MRKKISKFHMAGTDSECEDGGDKVVTPDETSTQCRPGTKEIRGGFALCFKAATDVPNKNRVPRLIAAAGGELPELGPVGKPLRAALGAPGESATQVLVG